MSDTQEAIREEFEQQFPVADRIHWDVDQKSYRPNNPFDSTHVYAAAFQNMKLEGWQAATAQSAKKITRIQQIYGYECNKRDELLLEANEKIARLEAENKELRAWKEKMQDGSRLCIENAAAELSNRQLREALDAIANPNKHLGIWAKYQPRMPDDVVQKKIAEQALAQPISTEALDAYVASKITEHVRSNETVADRMERDAAYFKQVAGEPMSVIEASATPLPPTPKE